MKTFGIVALLVACVEYALITSQGRTSDSVEAHPPTRTPSPSTTVAAIKTNVPYADAKPILETLREDLVPDELREKTPAVRQSLWRSWVARRDVEIRARLERGDEDSIVNFLLFGVTFTKHPRSKLADLLGRVPAGLE